MHIDIKAVSAHLRTYRYPYILIGLLILAGSQILLQLVSDWLTDDNYSHGLLVIPVSIYLFWTRRDQLVATVRPCRWGMALFGFGCLGLTLGVAAGELFTTRVSMVLILTGISLYYLGMENFRKVWFAYFFLLFMIPIPAVIYYSATFPMQIFSSKITTVILNGIGIPAVRHGNIINLPEYTLEVAEACSGLRSLVTLMALGALYGHMFVPGVLAPIILFAATIPVAIVTNVFRIVATAVAAHAISPDIADTFLHEVSGSLVFVSALIIIMFTGAILKWAASRFS